MKRCPVCGIEMFETIKYGVEIDICPKCRGVWLDRGELEKIVERIKKEFSEISPIYKEYIKKKKKKPIFFEIFGGIFGGLLGEEIAEDFLDFDMDMDIM